LGPARDARCSETAASRVLGLRGIDDDKAMPDGGERIAQSRHNDATPANVDFWRWARKVSVEKITLIPPNPKFGVQMTLSIEIVNYQA
jgi:hypothetical protein